MEITTYAATSTQTMTSGDVDGMGEDHNIQFPIHADQFHSEESSVLQPLEHHSIEGQVVEVPIDMEGREVGGEVIEDMVLVEEEHLKLEFPSAEPALGMEFESADAARAFYSAYADRTGFCVRNSKSFTSRVDDTVIMRRFVCSKQGRPSKKDPFDLTKKRRNRASSREGCKAMFQVNRRENGRWVVSRCTTEHCHALGIAPKPSASTLKKLAKKPWELIIGPSVNETQQNGLGAGGGVVQSLLEYFKRMQADNPAFFYAIQVDKNNCVANVFWADARARMSYSCFGDAVTFDMTCKINKRAVPFAAFTGMNHHRQLVVFGCAFLTDESEASFTWLFQTWLTVMSGRHPVSLVTGLDEAICISAENVFPDVRHRFCKRDVFSKYKDKLADVYLANPGFKQELKEVVNKSETLDHFELLWSQLLSKYGVEKNMYLQQLYHIRHKWVPVYFRNSFFAEISALPKLENMSKFFHRHSITTTTLRDIVTQFDKAMVDQYEKELQADSAMVFTRPVLKTPSPMEKQASEIYTKTIFDVFQEELVESSVFLIEKIEDGLVSKFKVKKVENSDMAYLVTYKPSEKIINCSCCMFELAGIFCKHVLRVCLVVGILILPEEYILKRWTKNARSSFLLHEQSGQLKDNCQKILSWRCNDLCWDAIKYAEEGVTSQAIYNAAKSALQKAFAEVFSSKKFISSTWTGR